MPRIIYRRQFGLPRYRKLAAGVVMSRGPATFREVDVKRALRAIRAAGEIPGEVRIDRRTGTISIEVVTDKGKKPSKPVNPWDEDE